MKNVTKNNLQPWLDNFSMLQEYERKGFLEVQPEKHEAYVTIAALHAMTPGDDPLEQLNDNGLLPDTARRLRAYAGYKSQEGKRYLKRRFAVHVVRDDKPHDLVYTLLLSPRRWALFAKDKVMLIDYRVRP